MKTELKKDTVQKFRREQLLKSGIFPNRDTAVAVLRDDREYTVDEAVKAVQTFFERQVK